MTDGLLLIRRRRPIGEPTGLQPIGSTGPSTIEGTAGAGRIVHALAEAGLRFDSVVQAVVDAHAEVAALRSIDLGDEFDTVVLGSHLVNLPDESRRAAFLDLAARHARDGGTVIVEHHPVDWAETAEPTQPTPGSQVGMEDVRREPPFVHAVSTFDIAGRYVRQPFTARVLSAAELDEALLAAGLTAARRLSPTLLAARRVAD